MVRTGRKGDVLLEQLQPIPLTPEILKKCGFDYDLHTYSNKNIWLSEGAEDIDDPMIWHVWTNGLTAGITTSIEYLHQLQNLYFALTGEELKINLNVEAHQ